LSSGGVAGSASGSRSAHIPPTLSGKTVALAEGRQLEDLVQLLEKEGATSLRCPLVSILDPPDSAPAIAWLRALAGGELHWIILMTGEGWQRLLALAEREGLRAAVLEAARRTPFLTRGPKPIRALKASGLSPTLSAQPPTTAGVIATLREVALQGLTVGVTLAGGPNPELETFLQTAGARVRTVLPYIYAPAADADGVAALIQRMQAGTVDAVIFTSSPQVERLYQVAHERSLENALAEGIQRVCVAAVGPVVAETLHQKGARVDVCPEQGFVMKNLVTLLARRLGG
jgi:uroporphyrinogen-III synthase